MKRVVVGLSGGVDSSIAAYLLKKEGYEVIGIFMKNWHDGEVTIKGDCPWVEDSNDALMVANKLQIPFQTIDLSAQYKKRIVDYMFDEYEKGRTPNPDILCNREIKFDLFLDAALKLGADYVATGHYCRKSEKVNSSGKVEQYRLLAGKDQNKDQSYFLCQLNQKQLSKALFPIGEYQKNQVREIASSLDLVTAEKRDSQGLCFIGKVRLPDFLKQQLKEKKGIVLEIAANSIKSVDPKNYLDAEEYLQELCKSHSLQNACGIKKGEHIGAHFYTIGQRKGLGIGGTPEPLFIIGTDTKENIVYAGQGENHPGLFRKGLFIKEEDIHWIRGDLKLESGDKKPFLVRIRYRQKLEKACLYKREEGIYIVFEKEQRGITPGQFAAWYLEDELIGSGVIDSY